MTPVTAITTLRPTVDDINARGELMVLPGRFIWKIAGARTIGFYKTRRSPRKRRRALRFGVGGGMFARVAVALVRLHRLFEHDLVEIEALGLLAVRADDVDADGLGL